MNRDSLGCFVVLLWRSHCSSLQCTQSKRVKAGGSESSGDNNQVASAANASDAPMAPAAASTVHANGDSTHGENVSGSNLTQQPDTEMAATATTNGVPKVQPVKMEPDESSEDEALVKKAPRESSIPKNGQNNNNGSKSNGAAPKKRASKAKKQTQESSDPSDDQGGAASESSEDEQPLSKRGQPKKAPSKRKSTTKPKSESEDKPKKRAPKAQPKKEVTPATSPMKKVKPEADGSDAEGEDEDENKFAFLNADDEGTGEKWQTLEHNGVLFPPDYEPLPSDVKLYYDGSFLSHLHLSNTITDIDLILHHSGKPVDLPPESEEVAGFFAGMLDTDHVQKDVFRQNFFKDFLKVLEEHPPVCLKS